ncbi:Gfo/Idh/MocA family protein [Paraglaciecola psychrophila]|uniref:Oxidoreductase domain-containing protein n=1 Tax=Paraglaciecola psychrophila 170 TaxID=1129794 RepID=K6Z1J8_9ALTE|nr:Gfo/Idh/MocA family oxidoreductase [Paraglaciecola psychrophila]AGH42677.1 oxidoreductase domain-containing protein [Paraglaciecola psychrophila 170]GAC38919.1 Gfo/Idh/MocA family oxidoreductase [Paraglaciecola psychrophila 170]
MEQSTKIRMGMVGGGQDAFIGAVHRMAANLDGNIELVCGAFSSDPAKSISSGKKLYLPAERCYADYVQMFAAEAKLPKHQRMQFVSIVTPNHLHFPVAKAALEAGFHVLSDKPATFTLQEALDLADILKTSPQLYGLTHTYNGYPLIKQAKHLIATGVLGKIRKVVVEYSQDWLANKDDELSKQAQWRVDPSRAGVSCCMGDIGVHAANLAEYVTDTKISAMCADLNAVVDGRKLDDDGTVLLRFDSGARGVLMSSQIAVGEENNLRLRIYGDEGSIDWSQMEPNSLWLKSNTKSTQLIRTGVGEFCADAQAAMRIPAGHPEGYLEAFANIYQNFSKQIQAFEQGVPCSNETFDVPGIEQAIRGMAFIENTVKFSQSELKWHDFDLSPTINSGVS